jgi:hypothetical protein
MTNTGRAPKIRHRGRKKGCAAGAVVKKEDYPKMAAMAEEGWGWVPIGKKFGVSGTWAGRLVRKYLKGLQHDGT